jgi:hypothetical protein
MKKIGFKKINILKQFSSSENGKASTRVEKAGTFEPYQQFHLQL